MAQPVAMDIIARMDLLTTAKRASRFWERNGF